MAHRALSVSPFPGNSQPRRAGVRGDLKFGKPEQIIRFGYALFVRELCVKMLMHVVGSADVAPHAAAWIETIKSRTM